jgi:imidazolonepropionase
MKILITNIKKLLQVENHPPEFRRGKEMQSLPSLENAFLYCIDDKIVDFGLMEDMPSEYLSSETVIDATGRLVFPGYCDPHTHLVYAGSREMEYIDKIKGHSYEEIAKRGGGILNSAKLLHHTSEEELFEQSSARVREIMNQGTCSVEIKSGYGLNAEDELKMLRVIRRIRDEFPLTVKANFLGAHAVPEEFKGRQDKYVELLVNVMIPAVAEAKLADFIDVFCDTGFFTPVETAKILKAGIHYGLRPKIHANELGLSGGIQVGVEHNALSVDHLEFTGDNEINALLNSRTMPTLLPGASFFLGIGYAPARKMVDSGLPIALASDFNPGSSPSGNMNFIFSLACIKLRMLPEEALNALTINSAYAMGVETSEGSITAGKSASFIITRKIPGLEFIPYSFGTDLIEHVFCKGHSIK